jgi:hypothetical protein
MKSFLTSSDLTPAGKVWLAQPVNLPNEPLGITQNATQVARAFSLSTREALLAICTVLSLAIGPAIPVRDPFRNGRPLALQILTRGSQASGLDLAIWTLSQRLFCAFNRLIGRRRIPTENQKSLPPKAVEIINERKKRIFPIGEVLSPRLMGELIKEDGDCSFGSMSDSAALRAFLKTGPTRQLELDQFIRAGWYGDAVPGIDEHPVYPVVSLSWSAPPALVREALSSGLLERIPGLLIVSPMGLSEGLLPSPLPDVAIEQWDSILVSIITQLRLNYLPKHVADDSNTWKVFEERAEEIVASSASFVTRYTTGDGAAASILRHAPVQITKLAALLSLIPQPGAPINDVHVRYAMEIYRWLVAGTLHAVEEVEQREPGSFTQETERVKAKLGALGAMTLRQLTSEAPRQELEKVQGILRHLMEERSVEASSDGKYQLVYPAPKSEVGLAEKEAPAA